MIVCPACGHHNEDDTTFCRSCGEFLEWAQPPAREPAEAAPAPEPEPEPVDTPEPEPVDTPEPGPAEGLEPEVTTSDVDPRTHAEEAERARREAEEAERARREAEEAERARREAEEAERARREAEEAERARRAAGMVARPPQRPAPPPAENAKPPPAEEPPPRRAPGAVKPAEQKVRRAPRRSQVSERQIRPGDRICGACGEGNDPSRNYCRRCGTSLAEAATARKLPWWKRLFRRKPMAYEAGARPMRRGGGGRGAMTKGRALRRRVLRVMSSVGRALALVAVVVGVAGVTVGPWRQNATDWLGDRWDDVRGVVAPSYEPVNATGADATSALPDHPAGDAIDLGSNTWWAEGAEGDGVGQVLTVTFAEPVDIAAVVITPGAGDQEEFVAQPRPRRMRATFGGQTSVEFDLEDDPEFQSFDVDGADGITRVEFEILAVYAGQQGSDMGITEIEFRTRK